MKKEIRIRNKVLGAERPLFIVAEIGVTCNYDLGMTKELIDVVAASGADAVKLILWFPDEIMSDTTLTYTYETVGGPRTENMFEMLSSLRFSLDQWQEVKAFADSRDVILFATVNSPSGIAYGKAIGLDAYKLSSWDFNYFPLWQELAELGKPLVIDTGPVDLVEVAKVIALMKKTGNEEAVLVHCFHTQDHAEMNMRAIPYMASTFGTPVGYSSADTRPETDIMAVTLGAMYLEKRLTLSRSLSGHHHVLSLEPAEFERYVREMKSVKAALGTYGLSPSRGDLQEKAKWFRSIVANQNIGAGTVLAPGMLEGKRPANGISPEHMGWFWGRVTKRELRRNEVLTWEDV